MLNRRFSSLFTLALLAAGAWVLPVFAQEDPEPPEPPPVRTVLKEVKHINPEEALALLEVLDVEVAVQRDLGVLALRGPEAELKTALEMISRLDVPPKPARGVDLRLYLVEAGEVEPQPLPAGVEKALKPLGDLLGLRSFRLIDTIFLRASEDSRAGSTEGTLQSGAGFRLAFERVAVLRGEPLIVHLEGLAFDCSFPRLALRTEVEVREGQVAVIGKASQKGQEEAMLVVLEADVLSDGEGG